MFLPHLFVFVHIMFKTAKLKYHECKINLLKGTMLIETSYSEFSLGLGAF